MSKLPPVVSHEHAPTPDTLWSVWGVASPDQMNSRWREPVYQSWVIASEGEAGLLEIKARMPTQFLAAAPLSQLRSAMAVLDEVEKRSFIPFKMLSSSKGKFFLVEDVHGRRWCYGRAPDDAKTLMVGDASDYRNMLAEGERILGGPLYKEIFADCRPISPGHPVDWLEMMASPATWGPVRHLVSHQE